MTMEVLQQLHDRKSVRVYEDRPVEPQVKRQILEAALQAPTAGNMALYTILDITDPQIKAALAKSCDDQSFIATVPMVLIFCADYRRWYQLFQSVAGQVREPDMGDLFLAEADAIIAAQNAVVAAHSLGLGSCYIGDITERFEYHKELLGLPRYVVPAAMLCFGYPTQKQLQREKPPRFRVEDMVHENGYDLQKSDDMERMLAQRTGRTGEELRDWICKFCRRKWDSEFSREMSRSCTAMVEDWQGKEAP